MWPTATPPDAGSNMSGSPRHQFAAQSAPCAATSAPSSRRRAARAASSIAGSSNAFAALTDSSKSSGRAAPSEMVWNGCGVSAHA